MRIGYLIPEFPTQTHAFFWREQTALSELIGQPIQFASTTRPPVEACRHDFADEARARTTYLLEPDQLFAGGRFLARHPRKAAKAASMLAALSDMDPKTRIGAAAAGAALARWAQKNELDHIHVHSAANSALMATVAHALTGVSYSVALHGDPENYGSHHAEKFGDAALAVVCTEPLRERLLQEGWAPDERIQVITMGVDTDRFRPHGQPKAQPVKLMTVARLDPGKGIEFALEALARLRGEGLEWQYLVIGEGKHRPSLESKVKELDIEDRVRMPGTASEDEVLAEWQSASIGVLSSKGTFEAAPVSVMEGMSIGVPFVVSRIGGTPWMIKHGETGFLVEQGDVDALTKYLRQLITNTSEREAMGRYARAHAEEHFDRRRLAERLQSALTYALAHPVP